MSIATFSGLILLTPTVMSASRNATASFDGKPRMWVFDTLARTVDELGLNNTGEIIKNVNGDLTPVRISDARQKVMLHTLLHTSTR